MKESRSESDLQIRIPTGLVAAMFMGIGVVLALTCDYWSESLDRAKALLLPMLFYIAAGLTWLLDGRVPRVSRWFAVISLMAITYLGGVWLDMPGFLALVVAPVALAGTAIGLRAAVAVSILQTAFVLLWPRWAMAEVDITTVVLTLIGTWTTFGVTYAMCRSAAEISQWSLAQWQQGRAWLETARDRQGELNRVVEDLAHANVQLTRLNALAQRLRQEAEDARVAKEQFVANVSHELRTPLNMIVGFCEMMVQVPDIYGDGNSPKLLADLDVVLRNSRHLSGLIDDVLDLSQIESGRMALTRERVSIREIIEAAVVAVGPLYSSKGLSIQVQVQQDLPLVSCDPTRIRQVVLNLLSNAGRFTHHGGVHLKAWQVGDEVAIAVEDTGSGIARADMEKIWQPFRQSDGSIRRRYGGTGLGLSISKRFVELHGGRIWVESEEGLGTTFTIHLPIDPPLSRESDVSRWFSPYLRYEDRTRYVKTPAPVICPRYVVLENQSTLQRLLARYLDGAEIVPASSFQEAIQELEHVPSQALIVNDVAADQVLRSVEASGALPQSVPAIGCYVPGTDDAVGGLSVSDYLVKPVSRDNLLQALDRLHLVGKSVLLVDDEPDALRLFRRMLASSGRGYRLLGAADGREALEILCERRPDVVLLDLVMPNMDGFRFLAEKSRDRSLQDIPVIVVSARDPSGQPIVSNRLVVTQQDGLSVPELLSCIEAITNILSTARPTGGLAQPETQHD